MTKKNKIILFASLGASVLIFVLAFSFDIFSTTTVDKSAKSVQSVARSPQSTGEDADIIRKALKSDPSALNDLLAWSKSTKKVQRERAASHLWRYGNEASAVAAMKVLVEDKDLDVRQRAYHGLSMSKNPEAKNIAQAILKNEKVAKQDKLILQLYLNRGKKGQVSAQVIEEAAAYFDVTSQASNSNFNRALILALVAVPEGKEKLKAMYEAADPKKITAKNASLVATAVGHSCPSNRYEYFDAILNTVKQGSPREQMQVLSEIRRHGAKGAELISANITKDSRLPANYTKSMNEYLNKKVFRDSCESRSVKKNK